MWGGCSSSAVHRLPSRRFTASFAARYGARAERAGPVCAHCAAGARRLKESAVHPAMLASVRGEAVRKFEDFNDTAYLEAAAQHTGV